MNRPLPEITFNMPDPHFHKLRKAIRFGIAGYQLSRRQRRSIAAFKASEAAKMAKFLRNCALNGRIETSGWN